MTEEISIQLIYKKIENQLSEQEERFFEAWIAVPKHQAYFNRIRQYYNLEIQGDGNDEEVDADWKSLVNRLRKQKKLQLQKKVYWFSAVAASIVVVLGGLYVFSLKQEPIRVTENVVQICPGKPNAILELADGTTYQLKERQNKKIGDHIVVDSSFLAYTEITPQASKVKAYNKLVVPRGGEFQVRLADGTKVWLNSDSHLKYPEYFEGKCREVFLEGEAYFEVAKDAGKPFMVYAGDQKVTVLGTCFGITSYPDENIQMTTLVSGKVKVEFPHQNENIYFLQPGFQIAYDARLQKVEHSLVDVDEFIAWKNGKYIFHKNRLEVILKTLSRWYDFNVFYQTSEVKDILFSGELLRFENFNDILTAIEKSSDVKFGVNGHTVVVSK